MQLIIAYPSDPFNPKEVDPDFLEEAKCFAANGFPIIRLSEELKPLNPQILKTSTNPVLYRGWMLSPKQYAIMDLNFPSRLLISTKTYLSSHHIVNWVQPLADAQLTAATTIIPFQEIPDILNAFSRLPPQSWFVKDYVKSLKTSPGPIISNFQELNDCLTQMKKYRGVIEGGIALRKLQHLLTRSEQRFFVANNQLFGDTDTLTATDLHQLHSVITALHTQSPRPFYSLDIARIASTEQLTVIEIGDGQVSDYGADNCTQGLELSTFVQTVQHLGRGLSAGA